MKTYQSKISIAFLGFVAGIAFLISCGDSSNTNTANANVSQTPVVLKDANGVYLGRVIGMETIYLPSVLTDQGYRTRIAIGLGSILHEVTVYYETNDCTGAAYVDSARYIGAIFTPGEYELSYAAGLILYTPNGARSSTINILSTLDSGLNCQPLVDTRDGYPANVNDPAVTGIQNTAYPVRMIIE